MSTATEGAEGADIAADESVEFESVIETDDLTNEDETAVDGAGSEDGSPRYKITVDGAEVEVGLDELLNGYQRQADYTRKTQAIASEREQLATLRALEQALNTDPESALKALSQAYGIQPTADTQSDEELDPLEAKVRNLESQIQRSQEAARLAAIQSEATKAISENQLQDVSEQQLIRFAMERKIGDLGTAALLMSVQQEREAAKTAKVATVTESKRKAAVVEGGKQRGDKGTAPARPKTIAEAFRQAMSTHS